MVMITPVVASVMMMVVAHADDDDGAHDDDDDDDDGGDDDGDDALKTMEIIWNCWPKRSFLQIFCWVLRDLELMKLMQR